MSNPSLENADNFLRLREFAAEDEAMGLSDLKIAIHSAVTVRTPGFITGDEARKIARLLAETRTAAANGEAPSTEGPQAVTAVQEVFARHGNPAQNAMTREAIDVFQAALNATTTPVDLVAPTLGLPTSRLASGIVPFGPHLRSVGVPKFLTGTNVRVDSLSFALSTPDLGTAVPLGGGFVLTNRHVYDANVSSRVNDSFVGNQLLAELPGFSLRVLPTLGQMVDSPIFSSSHFGKYDDWALMHAPRRAGDGAPRIRASGDLKPGEQVWILGDKTNGVTRLTTGKIGDIAGSNGKLEECALEGGFSGSPMLDAQGNLVGLVHAMTGPKSGLFVTTESIAAVLRAARRSDPSLPVFEPFRLAP